MDIFERIKNLNLPLGQYAVIGSAALEARGIRKAKDIDLAVTQPIFENLLRSGWKLEIRDSDKEKILKSGEFEAYFNHWCGEKFRPDLIKETITNAEIINGIPFVSLRELLEWKKAMAREKDLADAELIKNYLNKTKINADL